MPQLTGNTSQIKKINIELIKTSLKSQEYATKASISQFTGLSIATCGTILNELVQTGEVLTAELEKPNGGRPATRYTYNANFKLILVFYVKTEQGIHFLTYQVNNLIGEVLEEKRIDLDIINYEIIDHFIESIVKKYKDIHAIGIGVQGVTSDGIVGISDIDELIDIPLGPMLKEKYQMNVIVENDMNATVYGYYQKQNYQVDKNVAIVFFPVDNFSGAGIIVNGKILKGESNFAGEISFLDYDLSRDAQMENLKEGKMLTNFASKAITSIIAIINPEVILLTGGHFKPDHLEPIYNTCLKNIPKEHMPNILLNTNMDSEYMYGLTQMTLESLTYHYEIVEKKF